MADAIGTKQKRVSPAEDHLPLRIVLRRPPAGVRFGLQRGAATAAGGAEVVDVQEADGQRDLAFECVVRVQRGAGDRLRFLGPFAHGPSAARFVYVTVGKRAGQPRSPWDRRAKVPLTGITRAMLDATLATPGATLEAAVEGTLPDGSPTCATRPFAQGWTVRKPHRAPGP
jgi:hypothetical protein